MSLIEVWRDRRTSHRGPIRPPRLWKLVIALGLAVYLILRLSGYV